MAKQVPSMRIIRAVDVVQAGKPGSTVKPLKPRAAARAMKYGPGAALPEAKPLGRPHPKLALLQWPLIAVVALASAYSATLGQVFILIYGIGTLALRRDSREPFIAALVLLVCVPLFQILRLGTFENNAAIYAYELLVVGVVAAVFELKFQKSPSNLPKKGVVPDYEG